MLSVCIGKNCPLFSDEPAIFTDEWRFSADEYETPSQALAKQENAVDTIDCLIGIANISNNHSSWSRYSDPDLLLKIVQNVIRYYAKGGKSIPISHKWKNICIQHHKTYIISQISIKWKTTKQML